MGKRIHISATIAAFSPPTVIGIIAIMGWKMPRQLAVTLIILTVLVGLVAFSVMMHGIWVWSKSARSRYGLRTPIYKRKANPYQPLIDIAERQRMNPITHLVITDRVVMGYHETQRPFLRVRITYENFGLNDLEVAAQPEGYPYIGNERSTDVFRDLGGRLNVPASGGTGIFDLDVYVPTELCASVKAEVDSNTGEVRSLDLRQVQAKVQVKAVDVPAVWWNLGTGRQLFRPNREQR